MKKAMIFVTALLFAQATSVVMAQNPRQGKPLSGFDLLDAQGIGAGYQPRQSEVTPPPPLPKPELGPIDKWRYESCQQDAAMAPTQSGINIKMRVCREKFGH